MKMLRLVLVLMLSCGIIAAAADYPAPREGDCVIKDFTFKSGEKLPEIRMHYTTLGEPRRDPAGVTRNAVLILHGTGGSGKNFLVDSFAGVLFRPGGVLDAMKYYIILPDNVGHGGSSKPSDGLKMKFPKYEYEDMVALQYRLVTEGLGVNRLRLVMGTSMGGMHTWLWAVRYPDFMDALLPMACQPVEIAGRNRMWRKMMLDAITGDPEWKGGEYDHQPRGLTDAFHVLILMNSCPLQYQQNYPTREAAEANLKEQMEALQKTRDANDFLYYFDSSRNYNPAPELWKIKAPLLAVNSADDQINPPELGIIEREIKRVKNGKLVMIPISDKTRGHGTCMVAELWQNYLLELFERAK